MSDIPKSTPAPYDPNDNQITFFGQANFRSTENRFGIKREDRRRHMYVIGKTGMGKSTMLENMIIQDIQNGEGLAVVDPHGDLVEKVIDFVPAHRVNDVVYINPADLDFPIAFNILENVGPEYRSLVSNGLVGVFKKIWADSWGPRLEYILINTILALLEYPGATLLGVMRMLVDTKYRRKVVRKITDPVVRSFWINEFNNYSEKFRNEAIAPIQNKIGQFLSSSLIRNMVGQVKSTVNMRELMDEGKIVMMNLSKGRIGEENSALLGAMIITKIQLAAMSRVDIPEDSRRDFYLYVDEFQNFSTDSFAGILSEARKYHLNIIMAHQYIEQLTDEVRAAVFGNVGTIAAFRVGATDAEELEKEFMPTFEQADIVTLPAYQIYLRLMIDGVASDPFSANTLPPIHEATGKREKVIRVSRERYAGDRLEVERDILRWSGDEDNVPPEVKKMDKEKEREEATTVSATPVPPVTPTPAATAAAPVIAPLPVLPVPLPPKPPVSATVQEKEDELQELRDKALSFVEYMAEENNQRAEKEKKDRIRDANNRKREESGGGKPKDSRHDRPRRDTPRDDSRPKRDDRDSRNSRDDRDKKPQRDRRDDKPKTDTRKQEPRRDVRPERSTDEKRGDRRDDHEKPQAQSRASSNDSDDQEKEKRKRRKRKRSRASNEQRTQRERVEKEGRPNESKPQEQKARVEKPQAEKSRQEEPKRESLESQPRPQQERPQPQQVTRQEERPKPKAQPEKPQQPKPQQPKRESRPQEERPQPQQAKPQQPTPQHTQPPKRAILPGQSVRFDD